MGSTLQKDMLLSLLARQEREVHASWLICDETMLVE